MERDLVIEMALGTEERLRMTLLAEWAGPAVRQRIIKRFALRVEQNLETAMDESISVRTANFHVAKPWASIWIDHPCWPKAYSVGIQAQRRGPGAFVVGVRKDEDADALSDVRQHLDDSIAAGKSNNWWVWHREIDEPLYDWDNPDTLLEMQFNPDGLIGQLVDELSTIALLFRKNWQVEEC